MLYFNRITKYFGDKLLFQDLNFQINEGMRVGVVGPNGSGKSTLLALASGAIEADAGEVRLRTGSELSHLPQSWLHEDPVSGGEEQRRAINRVIYSGANLVLLDEPTNNLDENGRLWLSRQLENSHMTLIIASHDRWFLDEVATHILAIDSVKKNAIIYSGNYSSFAQSQNKERARQWSMYEQQQRQAEQLQNAIVAAKERASSVENETIHFHYRKRAKKIAQQAKAQQHRMQKLLGGTDAVAKPREPARVHFRLNGQKRRNGLLIELRDASIVIDEKCVLSGVNCTVEAGKRIGIVGSNGSGKTTLLQAIMGELSPSDGTAWRVPDLKIGYLCQQQDAMATNLTVIEWFRQNSGFSKGESATRTFLHQFLFSGDDVFQPVESLSCGEIMRLRLACFVAEGVELLVLDEPTNHLDVETVNVLEEALSSFTGCLIVVSHDQRFRDNLQLNQIWEVSNGLVSNV